MLGGTPTDLVAAVPTRSGGFHSRHGNAAAATRGERLPRRAVGTDARSPDPCWPSTARQCLRRRHQPEQHHPPHHAKARDHWAGMPATLSRRWRSRRRRLSARFRSPKGWPSTATATCSWPTSATARSGHLTGGVVPPWRTAQAIGTTMARAAARSWSLEGGHRQRRHFDCRFGTWAHDPAGVVTLPWLAWTAGRAPGQPAAAAHRIGGYSAADGRWCSRRRQPCSSHFAVTVD